MKGDAWNSTYVVDVRSDCFCDGRKVTTRDSQPQVRVIGHRAFPDPHTTPMTV
ncbi:hypothetical protein SAMN03159495_3041 [Pseudomonas sp. NFR16]|nr:hypothetical protein SAMN03159495_3041 [Pseudomonas sp. NFR16]